MTQKKVYSKKVSRERHAIYWDKALEFFESMVDAAQKQNWNAAGLALCLDGIWSGICKLR